MNFESWYQLAGVVVAIGIATYRIGRMVQRLESELHMHRMDLAVLFTHLGIQQPSRLVNGQNRKP